MTPNELEDCKAYLEDKIFISRTAAKATNIQIEAEYRNNRARMLEIALWAVNQVAQAVALPEAMKNTRDKNALCCSDCDAELGSILIFCPDCLIRHQSPICHPENDDDDIESKENHHPLICEALGTTGLFERPDFEDGE